MSELQRRTSNALENLVSEKQIRREEDFAPYVGKGKQPAHDRPSAPPPKHQQWTHKFLCVPSCSTNTAPRKGSEWQLLISAGLWEKLVAFRTMDCPPGEYRDHLLETFSKLKDAGGFELMRYIPNSNQLECLPPLALHSPRNTQEYVGKSTVYIRPIQKDLNLSPLELDLDGTYVSVYGKLQLILNP